MYVIHGVQKKIALEKPVNMQVLYNLLYIQRTCIRMYFSAVSEQIALLVLHMYVLYCSFDVRV